MKLRELNTALLLVDIQKGFDNEAYWGGNRNNKDAEEKCAQILKEWRTLRLPVYHIQHSSQNPKSLLHKSHPGFEIQDIVKPLPSEPVIVKDVNSAFIGTNLDYFTFSLYIICFFFLHHSCFLRAVSQYTKGVR